MANFTFSDDGEREAVLTIANDNGGVSTISMFVFFIFWYGAILTPAFSDPEGFVPGALTFLRKNKEKAASLSRTLTH